MIHKDITAAEQKSVVYYMKIKWKRLSCQEQLVADWQNYNHLNIRLSYQSLWYKIVVKMIFLTFILECYFSVLPLLASENDLNKRAAKMLWRYRY